MKHKIPRLCGRGIYSILDYRQLLNFLIPLSNKGSQIDIPEANHTAQTLNLVPMLRLSYLFSRSSVCAFP